MMRTSFDPLLWNLTHLPVIFWRHAYSLLGSARTVPAVQLKVKSAVNGNGVIGHTHPTLPPTPTFRLRIQRKHLKSIGPSNGVRFADGAVQNRCNATGDDLTDLLGWDSIS